MAYSEKVIDHYENPRNVGKLDAADPNVGTGMVGAPACGDVMRLQIKVNEQGVIEDAKFKTYGCGSAIASSSLATEWMKGKTLDEAETIKNTTIAEEPSPSAGEARPEPAKAEEKPADPVSRPTKVVKTPVRGGMQIYAAGGDLIVLAAVSPGAELLADGNIHVYGPMRGRALAGVKGDATARIFCQQLAAELVSIAGNYKVAEDLRRSPQWGKAVHVSLSGDVLNITRL